MSNKKSEEKEVRIINLANVKVTNIDGSIAELDVAKDVASIVYKKTDSLAVASACMDLFKNGKCEWSEEVANELKETVSQLARATSDGQLESVGIVIKKAILEAIG